MNKQIFEAVGVTEQDYLDWCKRMNKPSYKKKTKEDFFARIADGRLVKDAHGKLIRKYKK